MRIKDWEKVFEGRETRKLRRLRWVYYPTARDGRAYSRLVSTAAGLQAYAVFSALVGVAANCAPRGSLVRDDGSPLDIDDLSGMTRIPAALIASALQVLQSREIGWVVDDRPATPGASPATPGESPAMERRGEDRRGLEWSGQEPPTGAPAREARARDDGRSSAEADESDGAESMRRDGRSRMEGRRRKGASRGIRLPDEFVLSSEREALARSLGVRDPAGCMAEFRDYWVAVSGQRGCKVGLAGWEATWRNRCREVGRRDSERGGRRSVASFREEAEERTLRELRELDAADRSSIDVEVVR